MKLVGDLFGRRLDARVLNGRTRLRVLRIGFIVAFGVVALRLFDMMPTAQPIASAAASPEVQDLRGRPDIVDRNGLLLATDLRIPSVYADPLLLPDYRAAAAALAEVLSGVDAQSLVRRFEAARRFAWVKHQITPAEQAAVLELGIPGVGFKFAEHRVYPKGRTAAHVVGFVDIDNRGLAGIEYGIDHGASGMVRTAERVPLSIDLRVQDVVADELGRATQRFRAQGACGMVLDRVTGEILALVSLPDFDPNHVERAGPEQRRNRCTGGSYELGSIFKIVAHAMALESGKVTLGDRFDARSPLVIGRFRIRDDHAKNRVMSVPEIFMYSSNIGTARMAFEAGGAAPLKAFLEKVGFFERMPLEIPEVAGPQLPQRWAEVTTATVSFGHGIAVTPLQFASVLSGIAGDGTRTAPTLLEADPAASPPRERLVSAATAEEIRALMWLTVAEGTGSRGRVENYLVGGKTGTAEKVLANGRGYKRDAVLASFAAVFPIDEPRYVVLALLDEPQGDKGTHGYRYGGWTAAPVVASIIGRIGPLLGVPESPAQGDLRFREILAPGIELPTGDVKGMRLAASNTDR